MRRAAAGTERSRLLDLGAGTGTGTLDLNWASMSLHHLAVPGRALGLETG